MGGWLTWMGDTALSISDSVSCALSHVLSILSALYIVRCGCRSVYLPFSVSGSLSLALFLRLSLRLSFSGSLSQALFLRLSFSGSLSH